jgi:hypothetical protein
VSRRLTLAVGVAVVALAVIAFLVIGQDSSDTDESSPRSATATELRELADSVGHDVYWAGGAAPGETLELTDQEDGRIYVRYLSGDARIGDERADFTTIGTYPVRNPLAALRSEARSPDAITRDLPGGGMAYLSTERPHSIHIAWPDSGYEVEVYDPSPKHALDLVLSGAVERVP